jgi:hypothetical protein
LGPRRVVDFERDPLALAGRGEANTFGCGDNRSYVARWRFDVLCSDDGASGENHSTSFETVYSGLHGLFKERSAESRIQTLNGMQTETTRLA